MSTRVGAQYQAVLPRQRPRPSQPTDDRGALRVSTEEIDRGILARANLQQPPELHYTSLKDVRRSGRRVGPLVRERARAIHDEERYALDRAIRVYNMVERTRLEDDMLPRMSVPSNHEEAIFVVQLVKSMLEHVYLMRYPIPLAFRNPLADLVEAAEIIKKPRPSSRSSDEEQRSMQTFSGAAATAPRSRKRRRGTQSPRFETPPNVAGPPVYDVLFYAERVVSRRRLDNGQYEYLVKWEGYPMRNSTWELREQLLEDVPSLVEQYEAALRLGTVPYFGH